MSESDSGPHSMDNVLHGIQTAESLLPTDAVAALSASALRAAEVLEPLEPTDGIQGIKKHVHDAIAQAGLTTLHLHTTTDALGDYTAQVTGSKPNDPAQSLPPSQMPDHTLNPHTPHLPYGNNEKGISLKSHPEPSAHPIPTITVDMLMSNHHGNRPAAPDVKSLDASLIAQFPDKVRELHVADLAVVQPGRKRPPRSLGEFRLIPIQYDYLGKYGGSISSAGSQVTLPHGVLATYRSLGIPYFDASLSIGLVRGDWLVAVASAGMDRHGRILISQLQDVSGIRGKNTAANPKGAYQTGLHDGFLWRDTLVHAWAEVGRRTGVASVLVILGARNNRYPEINEVPNHPAYDGVAKRMGFTPDSDGNWVHSVSVLAPPHVDTPTAPTSHRG